jgi:hypothetical protein
VKSVWFFASEDAGFVNSENLIVMAASRRLNERPALLLRRWFCSGSSRPIHDKPNGHRIPYLTNTFYVSDALANSSRRLVERLPFCFV